MYHSLEMRDGSTPLTSPLYNLRFEMFMLLSLHLR